MKRFRLATLALTAFVTAALPFGAQAQNLKKVTYSIATADLNVGYPFATLARELGYFEEEGLDVDIVPGQSGSTAIQLLLSGRADIAVSQIDPLMIQKAKADIPVKSFYPVARRYGNVFVVNPDSPIDSIEDFVGKKIGVGDLGSASVVYLNTRLKAAGIDPKAVTLVPTGYGTPGYEALKNGDIDIALSFSGGVARMKSAGYDVRILPNPMEGVERYNFSLLAREDYIAANPDVLKGIGRATAKATVFMMTNPEEAVRSFWRYSPDRAPKDPGDATAMARDLAILKAQMQDMGALELPVDFAWGSQEARVYDEIQAYLVEAEQIEKPVDSNIFFINDHAADYVDFDHQAVVDQAKASN